MLHPACRIVHVRTYASATRVRMHAPANIPCHTLAFPFPLSCEVRFTFSFNRACFAWFLPRFPQSPPQLRTFVIPLLGTLPHLSRHSATTPQQRWIDMQYMRTSAAGLHSQGLGIIRLPNSCISGTRNFIFRRNL